MDGKLLVGNVEGLAVGSSTSLSINEGVNEGKTDGEAELSGGCEGGKVVGAVVDDGDGVLGGNSNEDGLSVNGSMTIFSMNEGLADGGKVGEVGLKETVVVVCVGNGVGDLAGLVVRLWAGLVDGLPVGMVFGFCDEGFSVNGSGIMFSINEGMAEGRRVGDVGLIAVGLWVGCLV